MVVVPHGNQQRLLGTRKQMPERPVKKDDSFSASLCPASARNVSA